jgi:hypothetical protein
MTHAVFTEEGGKFSVESLTHSIKNIIFFSVSMKHAVFTKEGGKFSVESLTHFIKNIIFFSVSMKHAMFTEEGGKFSVEPMEANVRLLVNGKAIGTKTAISHNDRIIFGTTKYFVFVNPKERDSSKQPHTEITFEMAQEEIAKKSGFDIEGQNKSRGKFFHSFLYACL